MTFLLRWLRRLSASDTAVRAVEESLLDWKHEVDEAPGVLGAFASDFRMAAAIVRLIAGVVRTDVVDAMRREWLLPFIAWMVPSMAVIAIVSVSLFQPSPLAPTMGIWWWALPGASLPYAALVTIARARRQPPALGFFAVVAMLSAIHIAIYNALHALPHVWFIGVEWMLLPLVCILLGDRIRREPHPAAWLGWSFATWLLTRIVLAALLGAAGGQYDRWLVWTVPGAPALMWLFFVWKQDRVAHRENHEEVTV
jgi:hypothetical protein